MLLTWIFAILARSRDVSGSGFPKCFFMVLAAGLCMLIGYNLFCGKNREDLMRERVIIDIKWNMKNVGKKKSPEINSGLDDAKLRSFYFVAS